MCFKFCAFQSCGKNTLILTELQNNSGWKGALSGHAPQSPV